MKYFFKKIFKKPKKAEGMGEVFSIEIPFNLKRTLERTADGKYERVFKPTEKLIEWTKKHQESCKSSATGGEQFEWSFSPSSIVEYQKVRCLVCGKICDDYVD